MYAHQDELSITDAAAVLGVHRITVHRWCRFGFLKYRKRHGVMFPLLTDVLAMQKHRLRITRLKANAAKQRAA